MAGVFVSCSRKDIEFTQRIHQELESRNRELWVDWQDIPPLPNGWMKFMPVFRQWILSCLLSTLIR